MCNCSSNVNSKNSHNDINLKVNTKEKLDKNYDILFKVVLIGDSAVGKSTLLSMMVNEIDLERYSPTLGIDYKSKIVDYGRYKVKLQLWDTAGQERFHTISASYYRNADCVIVVYDITVKRSFDNIKYWIEQICRYCLNDIIVILVGNKKDLQKLRTVLEEEGKSFANEYNLSFFELSAKNKFEVNGVFKNIIDILFSKFINKCVHDDLY
jgi:Ras-related protein Rab-1A